MNVNLSEEQIERYSRQIVLKEVGGIGQEKLLNSRVTLVGLGALGSPAAYYLTAAGIGNLRIIDFDTVERSNLHRQILHFTRDINKKKTESALEKLTELNPDCNIEIVNEKISSKNILNHIKKSNSDFVIEGSDNFATKMLVNDACINLEIPFTIAGVLRFHGQIITVVPKEKTTCYRCIFGNVTEGNFGMSCSQAGVIGLIPGVLGSMEANEAIKCILNIGNLITNKMLFIDLLQMKFDFIDIYRDDNCPACGINAKNLIELQNYGSENVCQ